MAPIRRIMQSMRNVLRRAVLTLRCTQRVRARLRLPEHLPEASASSGALGDWYVHLVRLGRSEFAIATSERCLLTMLLPIRELRTSLVPTRGDDLAAIAESLAHTPMSAIGEGPRHMGFPGGVA